MKTDLERKLEAIKEIKKVYYVGTQQAKRYLDLLVSSEEKPKQIVQQIKEDTGKDLGTDQLIIICQILDSMEEAVSDYIAEDIFGCNSLDEILDNVLRAEPIERMTSGTEWVRYALSSQPVGGWEHQDRIYELGGIADHKESLQSLVEVILQDKVSRLGLALHLSEIEYDGIEPKSILLKFAEKIGRRSVGPEEIRSTFLGWAKKDMIDPVKTMARLKRDQLTHRDEYRQKLAIAYADTIEADSADEVANYIERTSDNRKAAQERVKGLPNVFKVNQTLSSELVPIVSSQLGFLERTYFS